MPSADEIYQGVTFSSVAAAGIPRSLIEKGIERLPLSILWWNTLDESADIAGNNYSAMFSENT